MIQQLTGENLTDSVYRDGMPEMPARIRALPVQNGYPVPWFVAEVNGVRDFRVIDARKIGEAVKRQKCWVCGQKLGVYLAFAIGPMCAINRTISEPPSHRECAEWSAKACPFLTQRQEHRRENNLPCEIQAPSGHAIKRNPGAIAIWITKSYRVISPPGGGVLFKIGKPESVSWMREGREATRSEVLESIDSGYHLLEQLAQQDGPQGLKELAAARRRIEPLLPIE